MTCNRLGCDVVGLDGEPLEHWHPEKNHEKWYRDRFVTEPLPLPLCKLCGSAIETDQHPGWYKVLPCPRCAKEESK